jgi:hypothetical protein
MYIFVAARYRRTLPILYSERERIIAKFLTKVPATQSAGTRGITRASYCASHQSIMGGASAQSSGQRAAQNSARALRPIFEIQQVTDPAFLQTRIAKKGSKIR